MSDVVYVSKSKIERKKGPLRIAYVAGEPHPVVFSVHGAIAEHYKVDPATLTESMPLRLTMSSHRLQVEWWGPSEVRWRRATSMPATGG
jgi:hypothetical protein